MNDNVVKEFEQPGSKESNPATFQKHLTFFLKKYGHSTVRVEILTVLIDKHIPKYYHMKLVASVFTMLIINTDKGIMPNLFDPLNYDPRDARVIFKPYILNIMPSKDKVTLAKEATFAKYLVSFSRILLEYSQHLHDYDILVDTYGFVQ